MIRRYFLQDNKILQSDDTTSPIIMVIAPDENEKKYLMSEWNLDEHTLNSTLDPDELSRVEFEPDHVAIIAKRPKNYSSEDNFLFRVSSLGFFLFNDRLILVVSDDCILFEGKIFSKIVSIQDLLLKIIYRSIFHFLEHLKVINMISDSIEQKINTSMENKYLLNLFTLEKSLVYYMNAIHSNQVLIEKMKHAVNKLGLGSEDIEFLDDMLIENNQCYRLSEIYSNILASLMDARASLISNNLNVSMKFLNALVISIAIPTFITGMGGMSEFSQMIGGIHNWKIGYAIFLGGMVCLGVAIFFVIKALETVWNKKS